MITDFLKTSRSKEESETALEVPREFKECDSLEEWVRVPFAAWVAYMEDLARCTRGK